MKYQPFKVERVTYPITAVISIMFFIVAGLYLFPFSYEFFIPFSMGLLGIVVTKILNDQSKVSIFFETSGIRIVNDPKIEHCFSPWTNFSHIYPVQTYKGYECILLAPHSLNEKEAAIIKKKITFSTTLILDDCIVIPCNFSKEKQRINSIIKENISSYDVTN